MADYTLGADEVVILTHDRIGYGTRNRMNDSFNIVLTNKRLVLIKNLAKGIGINTEKEVVSYPLSSIKTFNERPHVTVTDKTKVDVYFSNGQEQFRFTEKRTAAKWVEHINLLATGREHELVIGDQSVNALPGAELVSGAIKDTVEVFKGKFKAKQPPPAKVAESCNHCGARLEGFSGRSATCGYCGISQVLGAVSAVPRASTSVPVQVPPPAPGAAPTPGPPPPPSPPPAWAPDPHRRHELRYWDGSSWTHHVSSGGVQSTDPV